jgi:hypothetical protein
VHAFTCPRCGQLVFFHNTSCLRCGADLAFDPVTLRMTVVTGPATRCVNAEVASCNWLADDTGDGRCLSCQLTRTRPADDDRAALAAFAEAEAHKRRVVFQLLSLGLPVEPYDEVARTGIAFDLLGSSAEPVTTGHAGGVITLDLAEVDDVHREKVRHDMGEPYRTVLGHFRHEIGHQQFTVLVTSTTDLAEARELFGDDRDDYQTALDRHYAHGAPEGWERDHVSEYATMHPAEDWAETFAHYLHIRGTMQTAAAYRLRVDGPALEGVDPDVYASDPSTVEADSIEELIAAWLPLSYALNAVNRSMGGEDLYPFVLPARVIDKLRFVHRVVQQSAGEAGPRPATTSEGPQG